MSTTGWTDLNNNTNTDQDTPRGIIVMWYGTLDTVPVGWALCDGLNDTPDLRDRMIMGAGSTYTVGSTGGSAKHTHTATIGSTALTVAQMPSHAHTVTTASGTSSISGSYGGST